MGSVGNSPTPYSTARTDLCGGPSVMSVPTAISRTYPVYTKQLSSPKNP